MKIALAAVAFSEHLSGISRHAANVAQCLLTRDEVSSVDLILAERQVASMRLSLPQNDGRLHIHSVKVGKGSLSRNLWYYRELPILADRLGADVVHLAYPSLLRTGAFSCPTVATLHDLYPYDIPANFGYPKVFVNRLILQQCLKSVDVIACVSESTMRRLEMHSPRLAVQKAVTVYNCVDPSTVQDAGGSAPEWGRKPFLLCVAQHRLNKNIVLAMRVFLRLLREREVTPDTRLIVVGIEGPETESICRFIKANDLQERVLLVHGISDTALEWCYQHCELLLAPSSIEGFGFPIVEAMLRRCRIVCSDIPVFREVGGSYCYYALLKPDGEQAFFKASRAALGSYRFRPPDIDRFSIPRIAEAYLRLYLRLPTVQSAARSGGSRDLAPTAERGIL